MADAEVDMTGWRTEDTPELALGNDWGALPGPAFSLDGEIEFEAVVAGSPIAFAGMNKLRCRFKVPDSEIWCVRKIHLLGVFSVSINWSAIHFLWRPPRAKLPNGGGAHADNSPADPDDRISADTSVSSTSSMDLVIAPAYHSILGKGVITKTIWFPGMELWQVTTIQGTGNLTSYLIRIEARRYPASAALLEMLKNPCNGREVNAINQMHAVLPAEYSKPT